MIVQSRRTAGSWGCSNSSWGTISTWTVSSATVNPVLDVATPADGTSICAGYSPSATITAGSGGSAGSADTYEYSINNGSNWFAYTSGAAITTTGAAGNVLIRVSRSAGSYGCSSTGPTTIVTWPVSSTPAAPALSSALPATGTTICAGFNTGTVTGAAGSGGSTGAADEYQFSIDGGSTYNTYTNGAAIATTGATTSVIVRSRRTAGSWGCSNSAWATISTWTIGSATVNPALNTATPADGTSICAGYSPSATITAGSGGSAGSADTYEYSINNGSNWFAYTSGAAITTAGATANVLIRVSRSAGSYGCSATGPTTIVTWPVSSTPTAPALSSASPATGTTICAGFNTGTVTGAAGSGGSTGAADEYQVSIDGGSTYNTYTNGAAITTTGATTSVIVQSRRTSGSWGCSNSSWNTISTWTIASTPAAPALSAASPATGTIICSGFNTGTVTGAAGSGGSTGAADEYQVSIDGGSTYNTYTNGAAITTTGATTSVIVQSRRTAGSWGCSNSSWGTISTWTVSSATVNPVLDVATPADGTSICAGYSPNATITAGSGGSAGSADTYEYSINNGSNWFAYTSGSAITTTGATANVLIRVSRSAGSYGCSATGPTTIVTWLVSPNANIASVSGTTPICIAGTATYLANLVVLSGGTGAWSSSTPAIAAVNASTGLVTGVTAGTCDIIYTITSGCGGTVSAWQSLTVNALPTTSIISGNTTPPCNETAVTYSVTFSAGSSYSWTVPSGAAITAGSTGPDNNGITVNFGTTNGNITVTETNSAACVGSQKSLGIALAGCGMAANFNGTPLNICEGSAVTYTNFSTGTTGTTTYHWDFGTGATPASANTEGPHIVTYRSSGLKSVSLTITDGSSYTETKTDYITVNPLPAATAGASRAICMNEGITLGAASVTGRSYSWSSFPAGFISTAANPTLSPKINTAYILVETIMATGCVNLHSVVVMVNSLPAAVAGASRAICLNEGITLGSSPVAGSTYSWSSVPAGFTSTEADPTARPLINTTYTLVETITATGCTNSHSVAVTVNPLPAATAGASRAICLNEGITLGFSPVAGSTYSWSSVPAGFTSTEADPTVRPLINTTYTLVETITATDCTNSHSVAVTVNPLPAAVAGASRAICLNEGITLGSSPVAGSTYSWSSVPAGFTSIIANPLVSPPVNTTYTVTETSTATGCTNSKSAVVTVNTLPLPTITGPATACIGSSGIDFFTEPAMTEYVWTVSSGGIITVGAATNTITVIWNTVGSHNVTVNYASANGCTASSATVKNITVSPSAGIAGNISGQSVICAGSQGVSYSTTVISNVVSYVWALPFGATFASGYGTPSIKVNFAPNASSGNISVYGNNACNDGTTSTLAITVTPRPDAAGEITGPATFGLGTTGAAYSVSPVTNATKYTWNLPAGAIIHSGANTNNITVDFGMSAMSGVITVYGSNECESGTSSPSLAVIKPDAHFGVYPVPSDGLFNVTISSPVETIFNISIYNHLGDKIMDIKDAGTISGKYMRAIDLRPIPSGLYYVEFMNGQFREVLKVIVNR